MGTTQRGARRSTEGSAGAQPGLPSTGSWPPRRSPARRSSRPSMPSCSGGSRHTAGRALTSERTYNPTPPTPAGRRCTYQDAAALSVEVLQLGALPRQPRILQRFLPRKDHVPNGWGRPGGWGTQGQAWLGGSQGQRGRGSAARLDASAGPCSRSSRAARSAQHAWDRHSQDEAAAQAQR